MKLPSIQCQYLNEDDQACHYAPEYVLLVEADNDILNGEILYEFRCCGLHTEYLCEAALDQETGISLFTVCPLPYERS